MNRLPNDTTNRPLNANMNRLVTGNNLHWYQPGTDPNSNAQQLLHGTMVKVN